MSIELLIDRRTHDLGGGFMVGRVLPFAKRRMVGPFIFWDHLGPLALQAGFSKDLDVRPHPHIGLSTVTYLYQGAITHRDSVGSIQDIGAGAVNWMTAGSGITHSERLDDARVHGATMHGIQSWVALPDGMEETAPSFKHHPADSLPAWDAEGVKGRLIAGAMDGLTAPVEVLSPLFYQHLEMQPGARHSVGATYSERAVYATSGQIQIGDQPLHPGQMAVLSSGKAVTISAQTAAIVMVLGGEPIGERHIFWNFVSSSRERLRAASADWQAGRMKLPDADNQEWIPLPSR